MIYCLENKIGLKILSPRRLDRLNTTFDLDVTPRDFVLSVYITHTNAIVQRARSSRPDDVQVNCMWNGRPDAVVTFLIQIALRIFHWNKLTFTWSTYTNHNNYSCYFFVFIEYRVFLVPNNCDKYIFNMFNMKIDKPITFFKIVDNY